MSVFELYQDEQDKISWRLRLADKKIIARPPAVYSTIAECVKAIESIRRLDNYTVLIGLEDDFRWQLLDPGGRPVAVSAEAFTSEAACRSAIAVMKREVAGARVEDTISQEPAPATSPAPGRLEANGLDGAVLLAWDALPGATSYNVYWSNDATLAPSRGTSIQDARAPWVHAGLENGKTYCYQVTALRNGEESAGSPVVCAVPLPAAVNPNPVAAFAVTLDEALPLRALFDASASVDPDGEIGGYEWDFGDGSRAAGVRVEHTYAAEGTYTVTLLVRDSAGRTDAVGHAVVLSRKQLAGPGKKVPDLDRSVVSHVSKASQFVYTGPDAIQSGVAPGTIEAPRAAVLRGRVLGLPGDHTGRANSAAGALAGVRISIRDHPQYGSARSREDGTFDMVVNGGGYLTVSYEKDGYLPVERRVHAPWQRYVCLPDVSMLSAEGWPFETVDLSAEDGGRVARGAQVEDRDGSRQAALIFPPGVKAEGKTGDGDASPLSSMRVRIVEYTVGPSGPSAMPRELPPESGYTYAVELSVEGAGAVSFDKPVVQYVHNFLNFPVGSAVPVGYYDRELGEWLASDNGLVVKILSVRDGLADLDVSGDRKPASAKVLKKLDVTEAERRQLAAIYRPEDTLWRVPIPHFSPWDYNWPFGPPPDAAGPNLPRPGGDDPDPDPCSEPGSIIEVQNRVLGEALEIAGTPFSLRYRSDRVPGRKAAYTVEVQLSGPGVPASLKRIDLDIQVAGRPFLESFPPRPDQRFTFSWDGRDAHGRHLQGAHPAAVRVGYVYDAFYQEPAPLERSFGLYSGVPIEANTARQEITLWQEWTVTIGAWDARSAGLGGWNLDVNHAYDPVERVLYQGDGRVRRSDDVGAVTSTIAGGGESDEPGDGGPAVGATLSYPMGVDAAADGSVYIADADNHRVRRIGPDGNISTIAGTGKAGFRGDGGPAAKALIDKPADIIVAPDGSIYIADQGNNRVRKISPAPERIITTVAGNGKADFGGDGGPATRASLYQPTGVALGPDGSLYIADQLNGLVRRVGPDGIIATVAGTDEFPAEDEPPRALRTRLSSPSGVTVAPDGSLYIAAAGDDRVLRVGRDGMVSVVAGGGSRVNADGFPATAARLDVPVDVDFGPDGSLYLVEKGGNRVRRVTPDGTITTVTVRAQASTSDEDDSPGPVELNTPLDVAAGHDGSLYIADARNNVIRRVAPSMPGFSMGNIYLPSEDGAQLFEFSGEGLHLSTRDAWTGAVIYSFQYDQAGGLAEVLDARGRGMRVERDADGKRISLTAPYGQPSLLTIGADGYLASFENPAKALTLCTYLDGGLLATLVDPLGGVHRITYDDLGRLVRDEDPAGGYTALAGSRAENGRTVAMSTAGGQERIYSLERLPSGEEIRETACCGGRKTVSKRHEGGKLSLTFADGMAATVEEQPDPRFGLQAPLLKKVTWRTPGKLSAAVSLTRSLSRASADAALGVELLEDRLSINGRIYSYVFDRANRRIMLKTPEGRERVLALDERWRTTAVDDPGAEPVNLAYDPDGLLIRAGAGRGEQERAYSLTYDAAGRLAALTDPLGAATGFRYDAADRVVARSLADGREIRRSYDANGNLRSLVAPGGAEHVREYTAANLPSVYAAPRVGDEDNITRYDYDVDGRLVRVRRPGGRTTEVAYAGSDVRALRVQEGELSYEYSPETGNLARIVAPDGGALLYAYDGALLAEATWSGAVSGTIRWTYDDNFRVVAISVGDEKPIEYKYDKDGVITGAGELVIERERKTGLLAGTKLGPVEETYSYNGFREVVEYQASARGATLLRVLYSWDKLGRLVRKDETAAGETHSYRYSYDAAGRLREVVRDGQTTALYEYDADGNRTRYKGAGGDAAGAYDAQDRLTRYGDTAFSYNPAGEMIARVEGVTGKRTEYQYDGFGNLAGVTLPDGTRVEYLIDGVGRRIGRQVSGRPEEGFLYAGSLGPCALVGPGGRVAALFVYGTRAHVPDYMLQDGKTYRILADHLGSVRLVVDVAGGDVLQRLDYDEFGNVTRDTNPGFQPFGFAGGLYDRQTGLSHFSAREYDPAIGRWTSKDPVLLVDDRTNAYLYAANDPLNMIDPSGLDERGWPVNGSVDNQSGERVTILRDNKYSRLEPGASTPDQLQNYVDVDGFWFRDQFYPIRPLHEGVMRVTITPEGKVIFNLLRIGTEFELRPWDPEREAGWPGRSPENRGASTDDLPVFPPEAPRPRRTAPAKGRGGGNRGGRIPGGGGGGRRPAGRARPGDCP